MAALRGAACLILAASLAATLVAAPALPGSAARAADLKQTEDLERIERYLDGIRSFKARILQVAPDGGVAEGTLYIDRPGRMRLEYDPPRKFLIVAARGWFVYFDDQLEQVSQIPIRLTPAKFLLARRIGLGKTVVVTKFQRGANTLHVTVADRDEPDAGAVTLSFGDRPLKLAQWTVADAQGGITTVALTDVMFNVSLDAALFDFPETEDGGIGESGAP